MKSSEQSDSSGTIVHSQGFLSSGLLRSSDQSIQISGIRVGERLIKILYHFIQIRHVNGILFHTLISVTNGHRHLTLTHKGADDFVAASQRFLYVFQNPMKILLAAAKACRSEEKDFFILHQYTYITLNYTLQPLR